jgi:hypothetical protein
VYAHNISLIGSMPFDMNEYARVISAFSTGALRDLLQSVVDAGSLATFRLIFVLNIISTTGFAVALFALFTMIARKHDPESRLARVSYLCPWAVFAVALLDYLFSVVFLAIMGDPTRAAGWHAFVICSTYVVRMVLIYGLALWGLFSGGLFAVRAIPQRPIVR